MAKIEVLRSPFHGLSKILDIGQPIGPYQGAINARTDVMLFQLLVNLVNLRLPAQAVHSCTMSPLIDGVMGQRTAFWVLYIPDRLRGQGLTANNGNLMPAGPGGSSHIAGLNVAAYPGNETSSVDYLLGHRLCPHELKSEISRRRIDI